MGAGALITNVCLKNLVARPRPMSVEGLVPLIGKPTDYSFPSGHTCASFACALVLYRILPKKYGVPAVILASLIAFSRLYVGVHYPTDGAGRHCLSESFLPVWFCGSERRGRRNKKILKET